MVTRSRHAAGSPFPAAMGLSFPGFFFSLLKPVFEVASKPSHSVAGHSNGAEPLGVIAGRRHRG